MTTLYRYLLPFLLICPMLLGGCSHHSTDYAQAYQSALKDYPGSDVSDATIEHFIRVYRQLPDVVSRDEFAQLYAPTFYFSDTLRVIHNRQTLLSYLNDSMQQLDAIDMEFLGYSRSGKNVMVRWLMTTSIKILGRQKTITTLGATHLRFNQQGEVVLHQDFWDSGRGVYDQIPLLGGITRYVRSRL